MPNAQNKILFMMMMMIEMMKEKYNIFHLFLVLDKLLRNFEERTVR